MGLRKIRQRIAGWLAPDLIETSDRYYRLLVDIADDRQWLSEFPQIRATLDRVLLGHHDRYRPIGTPPKCEQPSRIDYFRDKLRAWPTE